MATKSVITKIRRKKMAEASHTTGKDREDHPHRPWKWRSGCKPQGDRASS